eukprot:jgi/Botrbrau1/5166/Bobra.0172s0038.1
MLGGRLRDRRLGYIDIPLRDLETPEEPKEVAKRGGAILIGSKYAWHRVMVNRQRARRRRRRGAMLPDKEASSILEEPLLGDWQDLSPRAAPDLVPELELRAWLSPVSHLDAAEALGVERAAAQTSLAMAESARRGLSGRQERVQYRHRHPVVLCCFGGLGVHVNGNTPHLP